MIEVRHTSNRHIIKRIIVRGNLILDTPTCLGSGDIDSPLDLALLRDSISNHALLTGSSITGALRNYLHEYDRGYNVREYRNELATKLFGDLFAYEDEKNLSEKEKLKLREKDNQSLLIINDAVSKAPIQAELRDGVKIDSLTRTAENKAKYDLELLKAGTEFNLSFELLIDKDTDEDTLKKALAVALRGLQATEGSKNGEISIGTKKRRGFGRCHVKEWQVWEFDMTNPNQRLQWLTLDRDWAQSYTKLSNISESIETALKVQLYPKYKRDRLTIEATFILASPLLIRSVQVSTDKAPDVVHLKSRRDEELKPILSGTALTGALRHRAEKIINTLTQGKKQLLTEQIVNEIFGFVKDKNQKLESTNNEQKKKAKASRLTVDESIIEGATKDNDLVQNRIAIDRLTGGALHGALFNEQPIFGSENTKLEIKLELRQPEDSEIGLLLLLLKDLWTGDLPVGGTSSIGRGRLQGKEAIIIWQHEDKPKHWKIQLKNNQLHIEDKLNLNNSQEEVQKELNNLVSQLLKKVEMHE
jgi:CRISPR/Cas system CSM-associated protein Csm3 (group 7 of RAMP superfamily)